MKKTFTITLALLVTAVFAGTPQVEYYPNGNKKSEGEYNKVVTISARDSKEEAARKMADATKVGKWTYWYENGTVSAIQHYTEAGSMTGHWEAWYPNGQKTQDVDFASGKCTMWFENGKKSSEGTVLEGMVYNGKWTGWYENGNKNYEGSYKNGNKDGEWVWYDNAGNVTVKEKYNNGVKINQ